MDKTGKRRRKAAALYVLLTIRNQEKKCIDKRSL